MDNATKKLNWQEYLREIIQRNTPKAGVRHLYIEDGLPGMPTRDHQPVIELESYCDNAIEDILADDHAKRNAK